MIRQGVKASVGDLVYTRGDLKVVISEMRFVPSKKPVKDIVCILSDNQIVPFHSLKRYGSLMNQSFQAKDEKWREALLLKAKSLTTAGVK